MIKQRRASAISSVDHRLLEETSYVLLLRRCIKNFRPNLILYFPSFYIAAWTVDLMTFAVHFAQFHYCCSSIYLSSSVADNIGPILMFETSKFLPTPIRWFLNFGLITKNILEVWFIYRNFVFSKLRLLRRSICKIEKLQGSI